MPKPNYINIRPDRKVKIYYMLVIKKTLLKYGNSKKLKIKGYTLNKNKLVYLQ